MNFNLSDLDEYSTSDLFTDVEEDMSRLNRIMLDEAFHAGEIGAYVRTAPNGCTGS
jgi:hypothetical protein